MFSSTGDSNSFGRFGNEWSRNSSWSGHSGGFSQAAYNGSSTFGVINELKFLSAKSSRQSTIILAAFNIVSAAATAAGILYNSYLSAKRSPLRRKERVNIFTCVRGPDVYPFFLSLGIVGQGIIFAVSQAQGLSSLFKPGCGLISQFMWPAIFIVPYVQLVFTIETTLRALKSNPFPPRSKWTVAICLTIVKIGLIATGLVTFFIRPPNFCFASLFWFVAKWSEGGFALLIAIVVIMAACAVVIYLTLVRHPVIEDEERVGASRMIYYIALAIIPNTLMIPFFGYISFSNPFENGGDTGLTLSMVSTVVANVTGLMTGGLYLFLRSSTISSIGSKNDKIEDYENQRAKYQITKPNVSDTDFNSHITKPVTLPQWPGETEPQNSRLAHKNIIPNPLRLNDAFKQSSVLKGANTTITSSLITPTRKAPSSYALFPNQSLGNRASKVLLPSTAYSANSGEPLSNDCCDTLVPPPSLQPPSFRHRRDSSMVSSATVQIGLRLSNVLDVRPTTASTVGGVERTHDLNCPNRLEAGITSRSGLLFPTETVASSPSSQRPPGMNLLDTTMKTLPPVPQNRETKVESGFILNPTVYSPNSPTKGKVPSPKGVGFNVPPRTNTTPVQPNPPTPRLHGSSPDGDINKADWI
ncbi:hypothetical protein F4802DRAFT_188019 [Xylaria palmicola]|nr:hypothetical protein F4802DRAFT_188019 [Xylaria palmicola]